jgi:hypothetical protein
VYGQKPYQGLSFNVNDIMLTMLRAWNGSQTALKDIPVVVRLVHCILAIKVAATTYQFVFKVGNQDYPNRKPSFLHQLFSTAQTSIPNETHALNLLLDLINTLPLQHSCKCKEPS